MSILSTRETICKKLDEQFDSLTQPAVSAQAATKRQISDVKSQLRNLSFSPEATIDAEVNNLNDQVQEVVPDGNPEDIQEAVDFINGCDFLSGDSILSNPIALFNGAVDSTINKTKQLVDDAVSALPEFGVAGLIADIQEKLSGVLDGLPDLKLPDALDITAIVQGADKIINCVAGRCGPSYSSRVSDMVDQLQGIYDDFSLDDNPLSETWGQLDLEGIYNEVGLAAEDITKMDTVVDAVNKTKSDALGGINNIKGSFKSASSAISGIF